MNNERSETMIMIDTLTLYALCALVTLFILLFVALYEERDVERKRDARTQKKNRSSAKKALAFCLISAYKRHMNNERSETNMTQTTQSKTKHTRRARDDLLARETRAEHDEACATQ